MGNPQSTKTAARPARDFRPARPSKWLIGLAQSLLRVDLSLHNRVHIEERDLQVLRKLPKGTGTILTPNHADETDPSICFELSRRSSRRFILMGNREAFDEYFGAAGWALQRMGVFSVERGGKDTAAKQYSGDVLKHGKDVLVIFPEGEIFYLNELVQPFHSGAVDIGIRAIIEQRKTQPSWTTHIVPMAIKYRYSQPIDSLLEKRVQKMERRLLQDMSGYELKKRLAGILAHLLQREEVAHNIQSESARFSQLSERVKYVRHAILEPIQQKYSTSYSEQALTIDRAFQLSAHVRERMAQTFTPENQALYQQELVALKEVAHMVSWQPQYIDGDASSDRLAEMLLKLERELYGIKRPRPLAKRDVFVRIGEPVDLAHYLVDYHQDPHSVRHRVAEQLRTTIQQLIDEIAAASVTVKSPE